MMTFDEFLDLSPGLYGWKVLKKGEEYTDEQKEFARRDYDFCADMARNHRTCMRACRIRNYKWTHRKDMTKDMRERISDALCFSRMQNDILAYFKEKNKTLDFSAPIPKSPGAKRFTDGADWTTDEGHGIHTMSNWFSMPMSVRLIYGWRMGYGMSGDWYPSSDNATMAYEPDFGQEIEDEELKEQRKSQRRARMGC